jgi:hypothetical protein
MNGAQARLCPTIDKGFAVSAIQVVKPRHGVRIRIGTPDW